MTNRFHLAGGCEIAFEVVPEATELARWIVDYFVSQADIGEKFWDGQTIDVGWSVLRLQQVGDDLVAHEPDFDSIPIRWCRGVNNTVRHLQLQKAVCDLFSCDPEFPSIRHAGIVSPKFADSRDFTMSRDVPSASDSGWFFAELEDGEKNGEYCSLYQVALLKIEIVPFLALPATSQIRIGPGSIEVSLNGATKSSNNCELLRSLASSSIFV